VKGALHGERATVTFLLTDIAGSTVLWERHPDRMGSVVARHDELIAEAVQARSGQLVKSRGEGDSTFSVFALPSDAVEAAVAVQRALRDESWPNGIRIVVRAAIHTGDSEVREADFYGPTVNRCARMRGAAHGGQTVCSAATAQLVADGLPGGMSLRDLGIHRFRDLTAAEHVYQLCAEDIPNDFPSLRSIGAARHNLPASRTSFVGRDDEIGLIEEQLRRHRLVTLVGVGGCGKTRLALEVARRQTDRFSDGVFLVDLAPVSDPEVVPAAVAGAIGLALGPGVARDQLLASLRRQETLLLMDNCEHLIDACGQLADELLDQCSNVKVLATSREALGLNGEQIYSISSLQLPGGVGGDESDAVRLFCDRARSARDDFVLDVVNIVDVEEICRRLDGIPLAIELAAAQLSYLSPHQLSDRLGARLTLLTGGRRRVQRQQTLAATLDWSHDLLSDAERVLLRRLAVFSGAFALEAVEEICAEAPGASNHLVRSLVAKSLVVAEGGADVTYRLLETVRIYAEEHLLASGEADALRTRHRDYYLRWLESLPADECMFGDTAVVSEQHNLRTALTWSDCQGRPDLVLRIAARMVKIWDIYDAEEGVRWLTIGLRGLDTLDTDRQVCALTVRAYIAVVALENPELRDECLDRAIALAGDNPGFWSSAAHALRCLLLSEQGFSRGDVSDQIEGHGRQALDLATSPGARLFALSWLGHARVSCWNLDGAISATCEGIAVAREIGSSWVGYLAPILSVMYHVAGELDLAAENALISRDPPLLALQGSSQLYVCLPLPLSLAAQGRHDEAIDLIRTDVRDRSSAAVAGTTEAAVTVLGAMAALRGDWDTATLLLGSARAAFEKGVARSPIDVALYFHYAMKALEVLGEDAVRIGKDGAQLSPHAALEVGLRAAAR
jgi:predicted ATPase/class 3 adenylate cyclase